MKGFIKIFAITAVAALGTYYYINIPEKNTGINELSSPATVSEPLNAPLEKKEEASKPEENPEGNKEEVKNIPKLESLEGLEEESKGIFDDTEVLPEGTSSDPLEGALE